MITSDNVITSDIDIVSIFDQYFSSEFAEIILIVYSQ